MIKKTITETVYQCEHCGSQYYTEDGALECEKHHDKTEQYKNWVPWMIYMLQPISGGEEHGEPYAVNAKDVKFLPRNWSLDWKTSPVETCKNKRVEIYNASSNDYFTFPSYSWKVLWVKSYEDAYAEHGVLPQFMRPDASWIPDPIKERVKNIYEMEITRVCGEKKCDRELALLWIKANKMGDYANLPEEVAAAK